MNNQQKSTFFVFSVYRAVLCVGLVIALIMIGVFGPLVWRFVFGDDNVFRHQVGELSVHFLDVGQGDSVVIQLPDGKVVVIDSGDAMFFPRIRNYLVSRVVNLGGRIDYVIATHAHADHVGGLASLIYYFEVGTVFRPHNRSLNDPEWTLARGPLVETLTYRDFILAAYNGAEEVRFIERGVNIRGVGYELYFHTPTRGFIDSLGTGHGNENEISPIITLAYLDHVFVFTGDAGFTGEFHFIDVFNGQVDFYGSVVYLHVGHHGSNGSTSVQFLEVIQPNRAIISVSATNIFGHPHQNVLHRLRYIEIFRTDTHGNIVVATGAGGERLYFAFDEYTDLRVVFWVLFSVIFIGSFVNFYLPRNTK